MDFVALDGGGASSGGKALRKLGLPCRGADPSSLGLQWSRDGRWLIEISSSSSSSSSGWNAATRRRVSGEALLNGGGGGWRGAVEEGGSFFDGKAKAVVASGGAGADGLWVAALHESGHVSAHGSSSSSSSSSTGSLLLAHDIGARGDGSGDVVACGGGAAGLYTLR